MPWYSQFYEDNYYINKGTKTKTDWQSLPTDLIPSNAGLYNFDDGKTYFLLTTLYR